VKSLLKVVSNWGHYLRVTLKNAWSPHYLLITSPLYTIIFLSYPQFSISCWHMYMLSIYCRGVVKFMFIFHCSAPQKGRYSVCPNPVPPKRNRSNIIASALMCIQVYPIIHHHEPPWSPKRGPYWTPVFWWISCPEEPRLLTRTAPKWSHFDAAALPTVWSTVEVALNDLAKLKAVTSQGVRSVDPKITEKWVSWCSIYRESMGNDPT
jgi:hypothetical protein